MRGSTHTVTCHVCGLELSDGTNSSAFLSIDSCLSSFLRSVCSVAYSFPTGLFASSTTGRMTCGCLTCASPGPLLQGERKGVGSDSRSPGLGVGGGWGPLYQAPNSIPALSPSVLLVEDVVGLACLQSWDTWIIHSAHIRVSRARRSRRACSTYVKAAEFTVPQEFTSAP